MAGEVRAFKFKGTETGYLIYLGEMFIGDINENGIRFQDEGCGNYFTPEEIELFLQTYRENFPAK